MDINSLTIGEAKEIAGLFSNPCAPTQASYNLLAQEGAIVIAVLQRGHVIIRAVPAEHTRCP